jgi:hypothetical protein
LLSTGSLLSKSPHPCQTNKENPKRSKVVNPSEKSAKWTAEEKYYFSCIDFIVIRQVLIVTLGRLSGIFHY